jgi:hypothetical protein
VLVAKYGSDWGGWRSGVISGSHGVGLWKFICMGWQNFRRFFKYDPVKVRRFAFGRMFGVEIGVLRRSFPACTALLDSRKHP